MINTLRVTVAVKFYILCFMTLFFILVLTIPAVCEGDNVLTLREAIQIALEKNPDILSAQKRLNAAEIAVKEVESGFYPRIDILETYTQTDIPSWALASIVNQRKLSETEDFNHPGPAGNFDTLFLVSQPIYNGGKTIIARRIARTNAESYLDNLKVVQNNLTFQVTRAYFIVLEALELLKVREESVHQVEEELKIAKARFEEGTAVLTDVLSVEVRLAEVQEELIKATNRLALSRATLNTILGIETSIDFNLSPKEEYLDFSLVERNLEDIIQSALTNRLELAEMEKKLGIGRRRIKLSRAEYMPSISLFSLAEFDSENYSDIEGGWMFGVSFSINIFNGFSTTSKIRREQENLAEMEELYRKLKLDIQLEAREAYLDVVEARDRIKVTSKALEQAKENLRITEERYKGEVAIITELIDAQVALTGARTRATLADYDYRIAMANLKRATGELGAIAEARE